jgi:hypothetical protein
MKNIRFISETAIKENSVIETNVDAKIISNTISEVQELELKPILGKDLYAELTSEIVSASTISGYTISAKNTELLDDYIKPFLVYGTLSYGFIPLHYKVTNKGVNRKNDERAVTLDLKELEAVKDNYDNKFSAYKLRLINHLAIDSGSCESTTTDATGDSSGWYLPDNTANLQDYFEALANKTGFYPGYYRGF